MLRSKHEQPPQLAIREAVGRQAGRANNILMPELRNTNM